MKKIFFLIIIILLNSFINSQESEVITASFVSNISFETSNAKVLLQWKNPANFDQYLTVYRFTQLIDSNDKLLKAEKIATLENKEEKYIDIPKDEGYYFYAVIIHNKNLKKDYQILIPYRNYTLKPALIKKSDFFKIKQLKANSKNTYITLEWDYEKETDSQIKIMIYRNTELIDNEEKLKKSIKISTLNIDSKIYIDIPVPNIAYYYAVFIEDDKDKTYQPGINISVNPVSIKNENTNFQDFSIDNFIPLPLLTIKTDPKTGKMFTDPQILNSPNVIEYNENIKKIIEETKEIQKKVYDDFKQNKQAQFNILEFRTLTSEEIYETTEYKQEYQTAVNFIKNKDYESAQKIFEELIVEILPQELLVRVSYYLGMIYYVKGHYNLSYIYFIVAYDDFKKEIQPYLTSLYVLIFEKLER